jgi:predicted nuclease of predicted toxin-antitoxin system
MKFFADENVARPIVLWLRSCGQDVAYASEIRPGEADDVWLSEAESQERLILTCDKDFGELVFRHRLNSHGVVLLRLEEYPVAERIARLHSAWAVVEANPSGKFIVVTGRKVRVRPLNPPRETG